MWEIREQSSVPANYICTKCDQLQLLTERVVQLEKQLDTLRCIQEAERVIDTSFKEVVTSQVQADRWVTARRGVSCGYSPFKQGGAKSRRVIVLGDSIVRGTDRSFCGCERDSRTVCCLTGARILDVSEQVWDILKKEGKEPEVIIYIDINDI
eukprot:g30665.t1